MKSKISLGKIFAALFTTIILLTSINIIDGFVEASTQEVLAVCFKTNSGNYLSADEGGNKILANADKMNNCESFQLMDLGQNKVAIKTWNGKYASIGAKGDAEVLTISGEVSSREVFELIDLGDKKIALKASNGKYVCAENGGGGRVVANRDEIRSWETFELIERKLIIPIVERPTYIGLLSGNNKYLSLSNSIGKEIYANKSKIGDGETFELVIIDKEKIALKSNNGRYVRVDKTKDYRLKADAKKINDSSSYDLIDLGNNKIALRAYNDMFISVNSKNDKVLKADSKEVNDWAVFRLIDIKENKQVDYNLKASAGDNSVSFTWNKVTDGTEIIGYNLYRGTSAGKQSTTPITDFPITSTYYTDWNVENGTTYYYVIKAVYKDKTLGAASEEVIVTPKSGKTTIIIKIGSRTMEVNGVSKYIDSGRNTVAVIKNGRTFLPIRAVIESLGGTVTWEDSSKRVTINFNDTKIELWIGNKTAKVNGKDKISDVAPYISESGRTMLPLRFILENLGLDVDWEGSTQTITINN